MGCINSKEEDVFPAKGTRFAKILERKYDEILEEDMYILHHGHLVDLTRQMTEEERRKTFKVLEMMGLDAAEWFIKNTLQYQIYGLCMESFLVKKPREDADYTTSSYDDTIPECALLDLSNETKSTEDHKSILPTSNTPPTVKTPRRVLLLEGIEKVSMIAIRKYFDSKGQVDTITAGVRRNTAYLTFVDDCSYERFLPSEFHVVEGRLVQASLQLRSRSNSSLSLNEKACSSSSSEGTFLVHSESSELDKLIP